MTPSAASGVTRADGEGPIAEDWKRAADIVVDERRGQHPPSTRDRQLVSDIASALATQRAEIHARYEAVAVELDERRKTFSEPIARLATADAIGHIRQVNR